VSESQDKECGDKAVPMFSTAIIVFLKIAAEGWTLPWSVVILASGIQGVK